MGRKLKTYITSEGFFDKAIAAPSMKAALDAWGTHSNLFHQGFAKETDDADIIAATMEYPGVVLRRPVGSDDSFKKHAELPRSIFSDDESPDSSKNVRLPKSRALNAKGKVPKNERDAAKAFEQERKRREKQRRKEAAGRKKMEERREAAVSKAKGVLNEAEEKHNMRLNALTLRLSVINKEIEAEENTWEIKQKRLQEIINKSREG